MKIQRITSKSFAKYGKVIEYTGKKAAKAGKNLFCVNIREPRPLGWRIAYLVIRDKVIFRLEQHRDSMESFEPATGETLIFTANNKKESEIKCFILNKPVVLYRGIWHGVITLTKESEVKITENAYVKSFYWPLKNQLKREHASI
jgi:ureidoglycolate hydrolase